MRNPALEKACEEFFIHTLRLDTRLKGMTIVHNEENRKALTNEIVVTAVVGERNHAGPGGFDVEMTIEHRSGANASKDANGLIAAGIRDKSCRLELVPMATLQKIRKKAGLAHITVKDEQAGERRNTDNLRHRTFTIPVQADVNL